MIKRRISTDRGHTNLGWLDSYHTFSFSDYYDPDQTGFRALRVINEDRVKGGKGFDMHPHQDVEIISYIVSGALRHEDCMGNAAVMRAGEVQRISAGTGIEHSEYNNSRSEQVHFLQIWLLPSTIGLAPDYAQASFAQAPANVLTLACSPDGRQGSIRINQDALLFIGKLAPHAELRHELGHQRHAWLQLIAGDLDLNGTALSPGDGAMVDAEKELRLQSRKGALFLLFDLN
jgi:quercetin 2,3-dioxygenase